MASCRLSPAPTLVCDWVFPPGLHSDVYYIALTGVAANLTGERLAKHIEDAHYELCMPHGVEMCAFALNGWAWVQVVGHETFRRVKAYLARDGSILDSPAIRVVSTNECFDICLKIPDDHVPRNHEHLYALAAESMQASRPAVYPPVTRSLRLTA